MGCKFEFHAYSGCFSSGSYSPAYGLNLRMHSHEFLFPANESQDSDCIPMSSYSLPMNLRMHSHEFLFPANESQDSDCIPMSSYSLPNFWSLLDGTTLIQNVPIEAQKIAFWRDFGGTPIHTTWVPPKSRRERFRCLLRDFCFVANFFDFSLAMKTENRYIAFS